MVNLNDAYEAMKFWLPIITAATLLWKAYSAVKKNVTAWGSSLLDNHLHTIQEETKITNVLLRELIALMKETNGA